MSNTLAALPNLGPKSAQALAAAGITDLATLRRIGAVEAFVRTRRAAPGVSLNLLWALEAALSGTHWQQVARSERTRLLLALDDLQRSNG